jgi:hypothetical protein
MSQPIEHQLSDEDSQLIEVNHLGNPLNVYRLKPIYPHIIRGLGLFLVIIGCVPLVIVITIIFLGLYKEQPDGIFNLAMAVVSSGFSILMGLFILCVEVPCIRNQHLIICEQGLLEVRNRGWSKKFKALHWQNILDVRKLIGKYSIIYQDNAVFNIDNMYQNIGAIVELIRERSGIV